MRYTITLSRLNSNKPPFGWMACCSRRLISPTGRCSLSKCSFNSTPSCTRGSLPKFSLSAPLSPNASLAGGGDLNQRMVDPGAHPHYDLLLQSAQVTRVYLDEWAQPRQTLRPASDGGVACGPATSHQRGTRCAKTIGEPKQLTQHGRRLWSIWSKRF